MNILFLSVGQINPYRGGIDRVCYNLNQEFRASGHYSVGCSFWRDEEGTNNFHNQYHLPNSETVLTEENIQFLHKLIVECDIDILFNHSFQIAFYGLAAAARKDTKAKIVSVYHTDPEAPLKELLDKWQKLPLLYKGVALLKARAINFLKYPIGYTLRRRELKDRYSRMCNLSDAMVVLSDKYIPIFEELSNIDNRNNKIIAIPNPINIGNGQADFAEKRNQILFVGRLDFQKRIDRLLTVWAELHSNYPQWELVIVGDGDSKEIFEKYAKRLKLTRVRFVGSTPADSYFKSAKIVCVCSTYEGFGMVLIEAQQNGCVPIAYNSYKSAGDIITDGVNGFLVKAFSNKEYVTKLKILMEQENVREQMAKNGLGSITKFDATAIAKRWIELFEKL